MSINTTSPVKAAVDIAYLPPEKAGNKKIFPAPVNGSPEYSTQPVKGLVQSNQTVEAKASSTAPTMTTGIPESVLPGDEYPDKPGFGFNGGGLLQRAAQQQQQQSAGGVQTTATNQAVNQPVPPIQQTTAPTQAVAAGATSPTTPPVFEYKPVGGNALSNAPTMNVPTTTVQNQQYQSVAANAGEAPTAAVVQSSFTPGSFQKDGYTGVQGNTNFSYTPGAESLVENRVAGLLDPNNAIMRKAAAEAAQYAASRGLQSSSIGSEVALSTMVDKALPIASQDATTYNQAQQLGWQQSYQSAENNLGRTHDASMADKQGQYQTNLQNTQLAAQAAENNANRAQQTELAQLQYKQSLGLLDAQGAQRMQELNAQQQFQATENNASRQMQAELQQLQYKQSLGQLDAQGQQRMQELNATIQSNAYQQERTAQLQTERDKLLQDMSNQTMDKQYLQQLELTRVQYDQQDKQFMAQLEASKQAEYRNAVSTAYNNYLSQVGAVWADPNMTAEQKSAGAAYLQSQLDAHRKSLETLYSVIGAPATGTGSTTTAPPTGTSNPNNPPMTTNPVTGGGGGVRYPTNPDERLP